MGRPVGKTRIGLIPRSLKRLADGFGAAVAPWLLTVATASAAALSSPGCLDGGEAARVVSVGPDLDLLLADGRTLRLAGIDPVRPADDPGASQARDALSRWLAGVPVSVRTLAGEADRWGRTPALVFAAAPDAAPAGRVSIVEALLDAGLARARPDAGVGACWAVFLERESQARMAGLGLWTQSRYAVMAADDRARLLAGTGTMAIVEGRIARVGEGRARIYLSFGESRADFAITVERRVAARLKAAGHDPASWRGRPVRVRGFLDDRFGLQIELTSTDQIEFTDRR